MGKTDFLRDLIAADEEANGPREHCTFCVEHCPTCGSSKRYGRGVVIWKDDGTYVYCGNDGWHTGKRS